MSFDPCELDDLFEIIFWTDNFYKQNLIVHLSS